MKANLRLKMRLFVLYHTQLFSSDNPPLLEILELLLDRKNRYECDVDDQVRKKQSAEAVANTVKHIDV
jgi:hypothetical protein